MATGLDTVISLLIFLGFLLLVHRQLAKESIESRRSRPLQELASETAAATGNRRAERDP